MKMKSLASPQLVQRQDTEEPGSRMTCFFSRLI